MKGKVIIMKIEITKQELVAGNKINEEICSIFDNVDFIKTEEVEHMSTKEIIKRLQEETTVCKGVVVSASNDGEAIILDFNEEFVVDSCEFIGLYTGFIKKLVSAFKAMYELFFPTLEHESDKFGETWFNFKKRS
jgi:hypothetical protein